MLDFEEPSYDTVKMVMSLEFRFHYILYEGKANTTTTTENLYLEV